MSNFESNILERMKLHLDRRFEDFYARGIFQEYAWWYAKSVGDYDTGFPPSQLRRMIRQQAKEWRRPFVTVETNASRNYHGDGKGKIEFNGTVLIPRTDRCEIIAAPLFILPKGEPRGMKKKTYWEYDIADPDMWDGYMRYLHTDVDVRRALGVPDDVAPLPYEVTAYDIIRECRIKWPDANDPTPTLSSGQPIRSPSASSLW